MTLHQPINQPVADRRFRLYKDYVYAWEHEGTQYRLTIKAGVITDGASVPQAFWAAGIWPDGLIRAAALVHDLIYKYKGNLYQCGEAVFEVMERGRWVEVNAVWGREDADRLFGRLLREAGYSPWKRRWAYRSVRVLGWTGWGKDL